MRALVVFGPLVFLATLGCGRPSGGRYEPGYATGPAPDAPRIYVVGVHPLHNPRRLDAMFGPIIEHLAQRTGLRLRLEASRNYQAFEGKLGRRSLDFALPNPYQTVRSLGFGYRVIAKMSDDDNFRGIVLVRRDAGLGQVADLRGKRISFPAPTALAATMMPQLLLGDHGLVQGRDYEAVYVGSQDSSIMSVFLGDVAAAATWPPPWRALSRERPELARELVVQWSTDPLPNNGVVVRDDVPEEVGRAVEEALVHLHEDAEGRRLLARVELSRFEPATAETYAPVRAFLRRFEAEVRPLR